MEINQLRSFVEVAKLGHLTRAAEKLHLSQPALSGQIKALEEQLGITLFERSSSGMALTPGGRQLLPKVERIVGAVQQLKHSARSLRDGLSAKLKLGTVIDPTFLRVGDLLALAIERYPLLEIELHQVISSDALAQVREGGFDGSFYFGPPPPPDIQAIKLRQIVFRVALPAEWGGELVGADWGAVAARPWIVAPEHSSHRLLVMELFRDRALLPARVIEADSESVITNLVESGVGASLVREEVALASQAAGRIAIWPGASVDTRLWFLLRPERAADPAMEGLLDVLREVWPID